MRRWYVAKSKPQKESWMEASLAPLGVEVYFPRIVGRRRGKAILEPLFPTYLFCQFDANSTKWPTIRWAPGLNYFLSSDGRPCPIPDELVEYIGRLVENWNEGGYISKHLKTGDRVKIANGPFSGLEGIFESYVSSKQRCRIFLQIVGRVTTVELAESDLAMNTLRL